MVKQGIGLGTISLPLALIGLAWGIEIRGFCLGDIVLNSVGLRAWTNGDTGLHLTIFYSLILIVPALIIGYKYKDNFASKIGRVLSVVYIGMVFVLSFFRLAI
jgi:hypothetical protein